MRRLAQISREYDKGIPHSQTTDQPMSPLGRDIGTKKKRYPYKSKNKLIIKVEQILRTRKATMKYIPNKKEETHTDTFSCSVYLFKFRLFIP